MSEPRFPRLNKFVTNIRTAFSMSGKAIWYTPLAIKYVLMAVSLARSIGEYLPQVKLYIQRIIEAIGNLGLVKVLESMDKSLQEEMQRHPEPPKSDDEQQRIRKGANRRRALRELGMEGDGIHD